MKQRGFTVIELLVITSLLIVIGVIFWTQKNNIEVAGRDDKRKIAINAMYYGLEEVYYVTNKSYPIKLNATTLPSIDKALFTDPNGVALGKADSNYRYEATNCTNTACKSYTLRTTLENEADFVKTSRHN